MISSAALFADASFTFGDVINDYLLFVGTFFMVGAASCYFLLLRPAVAQNDAAMSAAGRVAARIGLTGTLLRALSLGVTVSGTMAKRHLPLVDALTRPASMLVLVLGTLVALVAFALASSAARDAHGAWIAAGIGSLMAALRGLVTTDPAHLVNPIHVFAASMWIGTLFVLVVAGLATFLSGAVTASERGPLIAVLVNRFSTIALWSAGVLVLSGLTTAYLHLGELSALWTSVYGRTLIAKLSVVACVIALGAYNNQRLKPSLGSEEAGSRLRRSASLEIAIAAVVLGITAVLVNLPVPAEQLR